jgi:uncharacterized protein YigE (DUF2233 family)
MVLMPRTLQLACIALIVALGCGGATVVPPAILPTGTPAPITPTAVPATAIPTIAPTPTLPPDWVTVSAGVELRARVIPADGASTGADAILVRIDPALAAITFHYDKENPVSVLNWQERLGALVLINAGFYQEDYTPAGLLVSGGERYGLSFDAISLTPGAAEGMFSLTGGLPQIRRLSTAPYDPAEPLDEAVQGLPMLIDGGLPVDFDLPERTALRTAVALDSSGRVLIIHVSAGQVSLPRLRDWLAAQTDLGITAALNLDGGPSTGLGVGGPWPVRRTSISKVPSVLAVMPR